MRQTEALSQIEKHAKDIASGNTELVMYNQADIRARCLAEWCIPAQ
jgi:hypothetical protein